MNNTDKQLLIDAAKAVGITEQTWCEPVYYISDEPESGLIKHGGVWDYINPVWNPLEKDEEAFKLMVDLKFMVDTDSDEYENVSVDVVSLSGETLSAIPVGDDRMAATRRAITTAAAELFRSGSK